MHHPAASSTRRLGLGVFVTALALYATTFGGGLTSTDAVLNLDLTEQMLSGSVALSPVVVQRSAFAVQGRDGRHYAPWGIGHPLAALPFVALAHLTIGALPLPGALVEVLPGVAFAFVSVVAAALAVWLCFRLALLLSADPHRAVAAAALAGLATPLWPYSGWGFNTTLTTAVLLLAIAAAVSAELHPTTARWALAGLAFGAAVAVRHELLLVAVPGVVWAAVGTSSAQAATTQLLAMAAGSLPVAAGLAAYNQVRFGSVFETGHSPAFGGSGYLGLLLAPGTSVLLFCPLVVLLLPTVVRYAPTPLRRFRSLVLLTTAALFGLYGAMSNWMGGRSYGPRYLVPVLVLLCVYFAVRLDRSRARAPLVVGVAGLSVAVQLPGALVDYAVVFDSWAAAHPGAPSVGERVWSASGSGLLLNATAAITGSPARPPLDAWWAHLAERGLVPWGASAMLGAGLLALLAVAARWTWRQIPAPGESAA